MSQRAEDGYVWIEYLYAAMSDASEPYPSIEGFQHTTAGIWPRSGPIEEGFSFVGRCEIPAGKRGRVLIGISCMLACKEGIVRIDDGHFQVPRSFLSGGAGTGFIYQLA